jgi:hypothetical protein
MAVEGESKPNVNDEGEKMEKIDVVVMKDGVGVFLPLHLPLPSRS